MTTISSCLRAARFVAAFAVFATLAGASSTAFAKTTQKALPDRLSGPIDNGARAQLTGSAPPRAMHSTDLGNVSPDMPLEGISLIFSRTAAQQADLTQLLADQQNPASAQYHQWLTPAQFGARFGISDNDLATVESWLQAQGFSVVNVSPSRNRITFSGPESAVEAAFGAPLHYFRATSGGMTATTDTRTHIAPAHDLTLPASLSGMVLAVRNLSDYRPQSHTIKRPAANFTSSQTGNFFLTPKDVATIYDINAAYNLGYYGSGQTITVAGESAVSPTDITNFQTAAGVASNIPVLTLMPNTGSSETFTGDEAESDLDLEYSSSIATKATVDFLYTGNSPFYAVFDAVQYAIDTDLGNIITLSYGECEPDLGQAAFNSFESYLQQAAAQGQTVINSAGDSGSSGCYGDGSSTSNQEQLAVSYPASSAYVTGLGGTEFPTADLTNTYFTAATTTDTISSAKSYIPEVVWNDDAAILALINSGQASSGTIPISSGGGGVSIYEPRPGWQSGTIGGAALPAGSNRLVPDVSLDSSPNNAGYLYCSSDDGSDGTGVTGSCSTGFRGSDGSSLTVAGGTSFAAPIFAGMVAIINQAKGYTAGQGLINPTLYLLAANTTTYASAFHDIVPITGNANSNACVAGATYCGSGAQTSSYATATGYDEATGLGSVDLANLIQAWPTATGSSSLAASITAVTANTLTPSTNTADNITINVSSKADSGATPTGTVAVTDNGTAVSGSPFTLSGGTYLYSYQSSTTGLHRLIFTYSGDVTYASSANTQIINVGPSSFTVTASSPTVTAGSSGTVTVTVTPTNGYSGTVYLQLGGTGETSAGVSIENTCVSGSGVVTIPSGSTSPQQTTYTFDTSSSACSAAGIGTFRATPAARHIALNALPGKPGPAPSKAPWRTTSLAALAGLTLVGSFRRRLRLNRAGLILVLVLTMGFSGLALSGCSNGAQGASGNAGGTTTTTTNASPGTYNFIVYASDSIYHNINNGNGAAFTVTVQ
ncbi:protease pro-enzyme activation domain-containing protein [Granulicella sp. 5B5]|uniref:protease pro-enzyme activation domain-containing protein n=1 Tax=Granulicella sp. 5B5 TaxID=1617967 RepID=UPI0015F7236B|nr:protease pro-enzyme activation domain-containing protein [Granulicella sp. 5B5]